MKGEGSLSKCEEISVADAANSSEEQRTEASAGVGAAEASRQKPRATATHRTVRLKPQIYQAPTLRQLCIQILAENADSIVDLRGVGQDTARQLLREIMSRKKLTYPLAKVFMEAGDDELTSTLASCNLWDAMPPGKHGRHGRHW